MPGADDVEKTKRSLMRGISGRRKDEEWKEKRRSEAKKIMLQGNTVFAVELKTR